ncbi:unnamed protein product, partial [Rotaria sp. Silwood1]
MSTPEEFFSSEASDWYKDVKEKSQTGEARLERYPLIEQRRAWMAVRYKLLKEFGLQDQESELIVNLNLPQFAEPTNQN